MLNVLDGLINQNRFDVDVTKGVVGSGTEGLWVSPTSSNGATVYDFVANTSPAFAIVSESNMDGTPGFTDEVAALNKVAVVSGVFRALTDKYTGSPAVGNSLKVTTAGLLTPTAASTDAVVAVVLKAPYSLTYLGTAINVIEFQSVI